MGYIGRRMLRMDPPGSRKRGRPKRRFMDGVKKDMHVVGLEEADVEHREVSQFQRIYFLSLLYFLRRLRLAHLPPPILSMLYRGTIESILSSCITAWFGNCTVSDRKTLQRIVRTAEKIIGVSLPSIMDIYTTRCIRKAHSIVDDHTHPSHTYFTLLPSGKRFRSIRAVTTRLCNSFFPQAIRLLNTKN
ncbi:gastrula zinc finger protein XlCGF28.1-like [Silurus asotus]|uniref:Gastrula zinc finger protein XlCGF28.1-like n=1 Tax=Silurus asotus TaxID=30991 RepID=A0AAD5FRI7_SILAS|nr:gastrula zinc finger protein XlCGF28.1-like [Silurus asotus]